MKARVNINVTDIRRESKFHSERISQAVFNEVVEITDRHDGYSLVRTGDGYGGWIDKRFLTIGSSAEDGESVVVTANLAPAYESPDPASRKLTFLPYGCLLQGGRIGGFFKVESDRYGDLFIHEGDATGAEDSLLEFTSANLTAEAEKFLGAPYLWGGRTFFGLDCSGFVQCIMRRFGVELPRDSADQRKSGVGIERQDVRAGDLQFFPRHVTLAISNDMMIHSSLGNGGVAYNSLDPKSRVYNEYYDRNLELSRRVIG